MKRTYVLERCKDLQQEGRAALRTVYTVRVEGERETEFHKFLSRQAFGAPRFLGTFNRILQQLDTMVNRTGFLREAVREEDGYDALPSGPGEIRFLLIRYTSRTAVLGGGGFKLKGTSAHQDSADLNPHRELIKEVSKLLMDYIAENELTEGECGGFVDGSGDICDPIILE